MADRISKNKVCTVGGVDYYNKATPGTLELSSFLGSNVYLGSISLEYLISLLKDARTCTEATPATIFYERSVWIDGIGGRSIHIRPESFLSWNTIQALNLNSKNFEVLVSRTGYAFICFKNLEGGVTLPTIILNLNNSSVLPNVDYDKYPKWNVARNGNNPQPFVKFWGDRWQDRRDAITDPRALGFNTLNWNGSLIPDFGWEDIMPVIQNRLNAFLDVNFSCTGSYPSNDAATSVWTEEYWIFFPFAKGKRDKDNREPLLDQRGLYFKHLPKAPDLRPVYFKNYHTEECSSLRNNLSSYINNTLNKSFSLDSNWFEWITSGEGHSLLTNSLSLDTLVEKVNYLDRLRGDEYFSSALESEVPKFFRNFIDFIVKNFSKNVQDFCDIPEDGITQAYNKIKNHLKTLEQDETLSLWKSTFESIEDKELKTLSSLSQGLENHHLFFKGIFQSFLKDLESKPLMEWAEAINDKKSGLSFIKANKDLLLGSFSSELRTCKDTQNLFESVFSNLDVFLKGLVEEPTTLIGDPDLSVKLKSLSRDFIKNFKELSELLGLGSYSESFEKDIKDTLRQKFFNETSIWESFIPDESNILDLEIEVFIKDLISLYEFLTSWGFSPEVKKDLLYLLNLIQTNLNSSFVKNLDEQYPWDIKDELFEITVSKSEVAFSKLVTLFNSLLEPFTASLNIEGIFPLVLKDYQAPYTTYIKYQVPMVNFYKSIQTEDYTQFDLVFENAEKLEISVEDSSGLLGLHQGRLLRALVKKVALFIVDGNWYKVPENSEVYISFEKVLDKLSSLESLVDEDKEFDTFTFNFNLLIKPDLLPGQEDYWPDELRPTFKGTYTNTKDFLKDLVAWLLDTLAMETFFFYNLTNDIKSTYAETLRNFTTYSRLLTGFEPQTDKLSKLSFKLGLTEQFILSSLKNQIKLENPDLNLGVPFNQESYLRLLGAKSNIKDSAKFLLEKLKNDMAGMSTEMVDAKLNNLETFSEDLVKEILNDYFSEYEEFLEGGLDDPILTEKVETFLDLESKPYYKFPSLLRPSLIENFKKSFLGLLESTDKEAYLRNHKDLINLLVYLKEAGLEYSRDK